MRVPRCLVVALSAAWTLFAPVVVAQERGFAFLDPQLGSPDGAAVTVDGARVLTWTHATATCRGGLTLWDVADRRPLRSWSYGPRTAQDPGSVGLEAQLIGRCTVALHPRGDRALLVRSVPDERQTGVFELDLLDPGSEPRRRSSGLPRAVTWSHDGAWVAWVEQDGSLVLARYTADGDLPIEARHEIADGVGAFAQPDATTIRWDLLAGSSFALALADPLEAPLQTEDQQWVGRLADGSEVVLEDRHVLRSPTTVWVDRGFDRGTFDFRGPVLADSAVSGDRVAWFDLVTPVLRFESPAGPAALELDGRPPRWVLGLGGGEFLAAVDRPGVFWIRGDAVERVPHPGGAFDQVAWSPDGRYLGVAGDAGLAVFDTRQFERTPVLVRHGRHSVGAGLVGPELCVGSQDGVEILHAAARRPLGASTRAVSTGSSDASAPSRGVELPRLLHHNGKAPFEVVESRRHPLLRLRLLRVDEDRIGISYDSNRLVVFDPREGSTENWTWPRTTGSFLEGVPLAVFRDDRRTLVVTVTPQSQSVQAAGLFLLLNGVDGNLVVLDPEGKATDVVRLEEAPSAALRERVSGDLLITFAHRGVGTKGLVRVDPDSLQLDTRYLAGTDLLGLAQIADDEILTWDERSLMRLALSTGDTEDVGLPGSTLGQPIVQAVATSPEGNRVAILFGDAVVLAETARLR